MVSITPYAPALRSIWDTFVDSARNGNFLFRRDYMDYHADRFQDASLMAYDGSRLVAILPANRVGDTFFSHQGLTFGGLIIGPKTTASAVCDIFTAVNDHLRAQGFSRAVCRVQPWTYASLPAEEPLFALSKVCRATLISRDIDSVIDLSRPLPFTELRRRGARKALRNGVDIAFSDDFPSFWTILSDNLRQKYDARPVHSLDEISLLRQRFPRNIRLCAAFCQGVMVAGTVLYISERVVKTQYISASERGKQIGALDLLFDHLIMHSQFSQQFLDLGTSALEYDNDLRLPLLFQKEGFGARAVCYDTYEWTL